MANDVTGVRGIAALRFDAPDAGGAILQLRIAPGIHALPGGACLPCALRLAARARPGLDAPAPPTTATASPCRAP